MDNQPEFQLGYVWTGQYKTRYKLLGFRMVECARRESDVAA